MINYSGKIMVIAGPTASGKSNLAVRLAKDIGGVIINGDSRQVYKEISIGTAKPKPDEMSDIQHFLYGHIPIQEEYNIYRYQKDVQEVLNKIPKDIVPIIVGGTGLYIDSIIYNYSLDENDSSRRYRDMTVEQLQEIIPREDLELLNESDRENPRRLVRLAEKGQYEKSKGERLLNKYFYIDIQKETLNERIETRVKKMIEEGLIEENKLLREKHGTTFLALNTIGYKEFDGYFEKNKDIGTVVDEIITHTKQYAKRQRTWFKRNKDIEIVQDYEKLLGVSLSFINS